ncbi:MAG: 5'-nucleotidase C-terminal domain-containing protein [Firmicutes bacterium]|nr:5'-nucleotidase C-terminal domain-containing protein [Bacillota bacterium]
MHTNDTHAHLDNIAHRATAVSKIRDEVENSLLLDAGDVFSGTLYFTQFQGQADLELMNLLGYDAMGLGNHEFDKGPEGLAKFITGNYPEGYKTPAQFPVVNANFDFSNEPVLKDLAHTTVGEQGADNLDGQIYPAVILDVNGEKVGVIGVATEDTAFISSPGDNIEINDAFEAAEEAVTMLESKGINKIVAISHLGWDRDLQLAEEVEGIDIVVGGHSHTKPDQYPALVDKDSTPTVVVQAKDHGEFLGRLDVTFDDHGVIISSVGSLLAVKDYAADAATSARLAEYAAVLDDFKTTVVGSTQVALDGLRANVRTKETNLGNLIADAMLAKASGTGATIAITNAGGIRASIDEGDITLGEVLTVMPFGNTLTVLELTGEQIVAALENGVSKVPAQEGRFPQVAGLKFVYDPAQPENSRMISVLVKTANGYQPIDRQAKYMVATNSFMAGGGDFYTMFKEAGRVIDMGNVDYEVFKEYLEKHSPVNPQVEGRIQTGTKETKPFAITASQLDRTSGIKAKVTVNRTEVEDHAGSEVVIFQLMKGTMPVSIVALEKDIRTSEELIAHFNETGDQFLVKAFVFDEFNSDTHSVQTNLAQPQVLQ